MRTTIDVDNCGLNSTQSRAFTTLEAFMAATPCTVDVVDVSFALRKETGICKMAETWLEWEAWSHDHGRTLFRINASPAESSEF